jgi:hypothetical protein
MRTGKHVARLYSPPELRYDYRGLRQIAKRLGWSVKRVLRTKQRDRNFPLSITFVGSQWCYVLYEERLQQWFTAGETVTRDHVLGLKGPSGGKKPRLPREGKPGPAGREPTSAHREESSVKLPESAASLPAQPLASKEPCPCGVPSRCLVAVHSEPQSEVESPRPRPLLSEQPPKLAPVDPTPRANQKPAMFRPEGCMCGKGLICSVHD